ncbi:MAG: hypothetical protein EU549_02995 [Promethearchaeota archaeon]|nr:MAG: hypothetical protein EU549_02995 [Candidatus Lokiarchaeota archaeon]
MDLSIRELNDPQEIIKYLQLGISIPIWSEFESYILDDLYYFKAISFILNKDGNPLGNVLIFKNNDILYFGYFRIINHNENYIEYLLDFLIEYAKQKKLNKIIGPINIPVIIYGWGFMKEGSSESLFSTKPVNPPIYQNVFYRKGFNLKFEEVSWEGNFLPVNVKKLKMFDFSQYEYFNPKNLDEFLDLKDVFLKLNSENFPDYAKITPNISDRFNNYAEFVYEFGHKFMIYFVRHKPTNKIVGCGSCLPNLFRKNNKGNYDSFIAYTMSVSHEYRDKGLALLLYGPTSIQAWKKKLIYGSAPTEAKNKRFGRFAKRINGEKKRSHLILEFKF